METAYGLQEETQDKLEHPPMDQHGLPKPPTLAPPTSDPSPMAMDYGLQEEAQDKFVPLPMDQHGLPKLLTLATPPSPSVKQSPTTTAYGLQ